MSIRTILLLAALCVPLSGQKIGTGYVDDFPLGGLRTFAFMQQEREKPDGLAEDPESAEFIQNQLAAALTNAGFTLDRQKPDFVIAFYAKTYLHSTYRVAGYKTLDSEIALSQDNWERGVLIVDFVSPERQQAVWRGRAEKVVNQKNAPKVITQACRKLVLQFGKDSRKHAKARKR